MNDPIAALKACRRHDDRRLHNAGASRRFLRSRQIDHWRDVQSADTTERREANRNRLAAIYTAENVFAS